MIILGFTGKLYGWWDNYLSVDEKASISNAISTDEGVNNLGMALVKNGEDVVYTLVFTILGHFDEKFTNQNETFRTLVNSLDAETLRLLDSIKISL